MSAGAGERFEGSHHIRQAEVKAGFKEFEEDGMYVYHKMMLKDQFTESGHTVGGLLVHPERIFTKGIPWTQESKCRAEIPVLPRPAWGQPQGQSSGHVSPGPQLPVSLQSFINPAMS